MATKATAGRKVSFYVGTTGDTSVTPFSAVRNWTARIERKIIDGTNNDSSGWRELVADPSTATDRHTDTGQRSWVFSAEAIYDVSTGGPNDNQPSQRAEVMHAMVGSGKLTYLEMRLGRDPTLTSGSGWAMLLKNATVLGIAGFVESVEVGGTYDAPVLYDIVIRGTGNLTNI